MVQSIDKERVMGTIKHKKSVVDFFLPVLEPESLIPQGHFFSPKGACRRKSHFDKIEMRTVHATENEKRGENT